MSLRVLSESLNKVPVNEKQYIVTTAREVNEKMLASYNKMKSIREKVEEIQSSWKSLQEDLEGVTFARYVSNGTIREQFLKAVDDLKLEYEDAKSTYLHYKEIKNKMLTESENDEENNDVVYDYEDESDRPQTVELDSAEDSNDIDTTDDNVDSSIVSHLIELVDSGDKEDLLDFMFNEFVPEFGIADTLVGELIRAVMHILFNYKLSGTQFYIDSGISECGGAAQFLMENGYEDIIVSIIHNDDSDYMMEMLKVVDAIARDILTDNSMLTKKNSVDSKNYDNSRVVANAPSFNYTLYIPYRFIEKIESGELKYSDIVSHVKERLELDADVISEDPYNDETAIEFPKLTKTEFDNVSRLMNDLDIWSDVIISDSDVENRNVEFEDIFSMNSEDVIEESVEQNNVMLTEDVDAMLDEFLKLHDDPDNYKNNQYGFEKLYQLFDSYGFGSDEDVDVCFKNLSEEDKALALQLIRIK